MTKVVFDEEEKKLSYGNTRLSFSISFRNSTAIYQSAVLARNIERGLRHKAVLMGINTKRYTLESIGATAGEQLLQVFIDFYHNHETYFLIIKSFGVLKFMKLVVYKLFSTCYWIRDKWYRLRYRNQEVLVPELAVDIRAEVDASDYIESDTDARFRIVHIAAYEMIQLVPIFEREIYKVIDGIPVRFHVTAKCNDYREAVSIVNYDTRTPKMSNKTQKYLNSLKAKYRTHRISFYKTPVLGMLRAHVFKGVDIF